MSDQSTILESVAKILVINDKSEVLVLTLGKHLKYPEKSYRPDLPGGIVDLGESEQRAVIREVQEECGIDLDRSNVQLACAETVYYEKENKSVTKLLYIAYLNNTPKINLSWEHCDYRWMAVGELRTVDFRPFFDEAIQYLIIHKII